MNNYISKLILPLFNKKPVTDLNKYVGTYKLEGGYDSLKIILRNGSLYSTYLQEVSGEQPLTAAGNNQFNGAKKGSYSVFYSFLQSKEGEIKYLNLGQLMWVKQ